MKKVVFCSLGMLVLSLFLWGGYKQQNEAAIQEGIAEKIIRFHVIANSDREEDQQLKLKVKETVVTSMEPMIRDCNSVNEVRESLKLHKEEIKAIAQKVIQEEGYDYQVAVSLTSCYFPVKTYGEFTFPDGTYEALRIVIGEGEGKNWWCVMYPRLCFVDSLYTVVPEKSKKELKRELSDEEYEAILNGKREVKVKSKLLEWLGF